MKKIIIIALAILLIPVASSAAIDANFNANRIIEDQDILDYDSMSLPDIQKFLQSKSSYLANYFTPNTHGMTKMASEIIYDAAYNNYDCDGVTLSDNPTELEKKQKCKSITTISPKFLLVLLQKESSLIEDPSPTQTHLDWATGYGCPDNWVCNPYYKGFGKQVNSAALQFLAYMKEPERYSFKKGGTYTFNNPYGTISNEKMIVTPENQATAALYNYTPHVFNGNYNVYKLWNKYFPDGGTVNQVKLQYPDGSILKSKDSPVVWLIQNGHKKPFLNWASFISRFRPDQIVEVDAEELEGYPEANAIKFPNYALIKVNEATIYLIVDNEKRPFANMETFQKIGFNPEELEVATEADLSSYKLGATITITSSHVTGALIQDAKSGGVYYVENDTKAPIIDKIFLETKFKDKTVNKEVNGELSNYTKIDPVKFDDGELLRSKLYSTIYLISNGEKRPFASVSRFQALGYKLDNVIDVSPQVLYQYPLGSTIE